MATRMPTKKSRWTKAKALGLIFFHLLSFYFSCSVQFNTLFAYREERQEFDFVASNEAIEYLANICKYVQLDEL